MFEFLCFHIRWITNHDIESPILLKHFAEPCMPEEELIIGCYVLNVGNINIDTLDSYLLLNLLLNALAHATTHVMILLAVITLDSIFYLGTNDVNLSFKHIKLMASTYLRLRVHDVAEIESLVLLQERVALHNLEVHVRQYVWFVGIRDE